MYIRIVSVNEILSFKVSTETITIPLSCDIIATISSTLGVRDITNGDSTAKNIVSKIMLPIIIKYLLPILFFKFINKIPLSSVYKTLKPI